MALKAPSAGNLTERQGHKMLKPEQIKHKLADSSGPQTRLILSLYAHCLRFSCVVVFCLQIHARNDLPLIIILLSHCN